MGKITQSPSACAAVVANTLHRTNEDAVIGIPKGDGAGNYAAAVSNTDFAAATHAPRHTDGNDDIQSATNAQKGVATAAQITALEANTVHKGFAGTDHSDVGLNNTHRTNVDAIDGVIEGDGAGAYSVSYFGMEFDDAQSEAQSSVTGDNAYHEKLKLTTASIPAGTYRIGWYAERSMNDEGLPYKFRVQVDDTTDLCEPSPVQKKKFEDGAWTSVSGFKSNVVLTAAVHTIDIDYGTSDAGKTAYIRKARLEIWRII